MDKHATSRNIFDDFLLSNMSTPLATYVLKTKYLCVHVSTNHYLMQILCIGENFSAIVAQKHLPVV